MFALRIYELGDINKQNAVFTWYNDDEQMLKKIAEDVCKYSKTHYATVDNINPDVIFNKILVFDENRQCVNIFKGFDDMDGITLGRIYNQFTPLMAFRDMQ